MAEPASLDQRIQVFRNMVAADPENELANFSLGKLLFEKGDLAGAEPALRKALSLNPRISAAIQVLGELLARTGRREEAIEVLSRGVETAHQKGEYQPRNRMQEILRSLGVEPPDPEARARAAPAAESTGGWSCRRCGLDNPRLERPPFKSPVGQQIFDSICVSCWDEWKKQMSVKVINEYRLNLATEQGAKIYDQHLREFLGLDGA
jgi:Fe-S cluster biosynthesis and repair protein YggX